MRRLLNPLFRELADLARAWDAFWFTPADPTLLGVLRILTGLMLLYTHAVWGLVLDEFFGPASWLSADLVRTIQADQYAYSFWWLVPAGGIWAAYGVSMVILLLFTVGLFTRLTSILSLDRRDLVRPSRPGGDVRARPDQRHADALPGHRPERPGALARPLARPPPAGGARSAPTPSAGANLALRLINVHMCVIYFFAGISKLQGESWWTGEAIWRAMANLEYQTIDMTWMAWHPWLINLATHVSRALGGLLLYADLASPPPPLDAGRRGRPPRRDRRLPGHVDLRPDHAGRLRIVPAGRASSRPRGGPVPRTLPRRGSGRARTFLRDSPALRFLDEPIRGPGAGPRG